MKALFRTDASLEIGTGHVMRCLTLADALRLRGCESVFVCREHNGHLGELIRQRGHAIHLLPKTTQPRPLNFSDQPPHLAWLGADWEADAEQTSALARSAGFDLLVVDHYALDARWERKLRPFCKRVLAIDDVADREHDCDFLLDQNLIAEFGHRYAGKVPAACVQMLGPAYALLQPQYAELHDKLPVREGAVRRILIYFGGADADNLTGMAISACLALPCHVDVVINPKGPHIEALRKQVQGHERIVLHEDLPSLASLMSKADLAIGAGGATSWERCSLGLPCLVITLADNQKPIADELNRQGFIRWLGHKDAVSERQLSNVLKSLVADGIDPSWSAQCYALVDGIGATRVSETLTGLKRSDLIVRRGTRKDLSHLMADTGAWFSQALRDVGDSRVYVAETHSGALLGYVLFRRVAGKWESASGFTQIASSPSLRGTIIKAAFGGLRGDTNDCLSFGSSWTGPAVAGLASAIAKTNVHKSLAITLCSDQGSWINDAMPELVLDCLTAGHRVTWSHSADEAPAGDLCFYLSYGRIVDRDVRSKYAHNLVVHESDLPQGRGWAPMSWQILEGASSITVTLLEAEDDVDAGAIYLQDKIDLSGDELCADWRALQARSTFKLCREFIENYPAVLAQARPQAGEATFYRRRRAEDSRLNPDLSIREQFNLFRIVNNQDYPAFFELNGKRYRIQIEHE